MIPKFLYKHYSHLSQVPSVFRTQWYKTEKLYRFQNRKLSKLIKHAYEQVPYYRQIFDNFGFKPADISSKEDLAFLPILTKEIVKTNYPEKIVAKKTDMRKVSRRTTAGSSGNMLEHLIDLSSTCQYRLHQLRQLFDLGYNVRDLIAYIRNTEPPTKAFFQNMGFLRRHFIQLTMTPEEQIQALLKIKPQIINAYPTVLYLLAKNIRRQDARSLDVKFILSNSETLYDNIRSTIEETFNCKVYDDYSCLEFSSIAFECRFQKMHITADNVIVEIVDDNGNLLSDGFQGNIVVTALNNRAMPFIRYKIGDVGTIDTQPCPCGRGFPVFKQLLGRSDDLLQMPDGSILDPQTAVFQVETVPGVMEFQIIQKDLRQLQVNVIPLGGNPVEDIVSSIHSNLHSIIPSGIVVNVNIVDSLDRGYTGKLRSVRSLLLNG